jgi:hypothetical protein
MFKFKLKFGIWKERKDKRK